MRESMKPVLFQRDTGLFNRLMPTATTILCVFATVVPIHLPGFAVVTPAFVLVAVYHWSIYRPDLLPFVATFAAGLLLDLLNGAPLGISSLVLLLSRALVVGQRGLFVGHGFTVVWAGFVGLAAAAAVFEWTIVSVFYGLLLDPRPFLFQAVLTVSAFPVVSYFLVRAQRGLLMRA